MKHGCVSAFSPFCLSFLAFFIVVVVVVVVVAVVVFAAAAVFEDLSFHYLFFSPTCRRSTWALGRIAAIVARRS